MTPDEPETPATAGQNGDAVSPEQTPKQEPAPTPAPETVDELIPLAPLDSGPAPDVQAALGALDAAAPAPGPVDGAPLQGDVTTPRPKLWSERKITRAKPKELRDYVRELQKAPPAPHAAAPGAAPAPAPTSDDVAAMLRAIMPAVNAIVVHFGGKELDATKEEQALLAKTWAPAAAPHMARVQEKLPLLPAVAATLGVYVPKVIARVQAAKSAAPAVAEPGQGEPAPAGVVMPGVPDQPFGGPIE